MSSVRNSYFLTTSIADSALYAFESFDVLPGGNGEHSSGSTFRLCQCGKQAMGFKVYRNLCATIRSWNILPVNNFQLDRLCSY